MPKTLHPYYLQQMGIETWTIRKTPLEHIKLLVIGEAMDTNKPAQNLFNRMLNTIGLLPEDICLKSNLSSTLIQEIINNPPKLLLAIGHVAIQLLLNEQLNNVRGKIHAYHNIPLIVSHHPIDLLQHPLDKKQAYHDLLLMQKLFV